MEKDFSWKKKKFKLKKKFGNWEKQKNNILKSWIKQRAETIEETQKSDETSHDRCEDVKFSIRGATEIMSNEYMKHSLKDAWVKTREL